jgi:hypothetical protein
MRLRLAPLKLAPLPFFIGFGVGLLALSWLGATLQSSHLVRNFVRFHQLISVESGYFPTARQVRSIVDEPGPAELKVNVIVGGSSVFHGVGQHESLIWTKHLQEQLGSQFRVINFAQRAGMSADFGNIGAELLLRESRPVIYVADGGVSQFTIPIEASFYKHIVFDAWNRGYLLPWPARDKLLSQAERYGSPPIRAAALGGWLNVYLNFNDFWHFVGYEHAGLNWYPLLRTQSLRPRRMFADPDLTPEQYAPLRYRADQMDLAMRIIRGQIIPTDDAHWRRTIERTNQLMPLQLRAVTLAVIDLESPYYLDHLDPAQREAFVNQADHHARRLREIGFNRATVAAKDFTADDYVDRVHLSVSGGQKLAVALAPTIRTMAMEMGYLP